MPILVVKWFGYINFHGPTFTNRWYHYVRHREHMYYVEYWMLHNGKDIVFVVVLYNSASEVRDVFYTFVWTILGRFCLIWTMKAWICTACSVSIWSNMASSVRKVPVLPTPALNDRQCLRMKILVNHLDWIFRGPEVIE